jgi:hypothetical protein
VGGGAAAEGGGDRRPQSPSQHRGGQQEKEAKAFKRAVYISNCEARDDQIAGTQGTQGTQGSTTWPPAPAYFGKGFVPPPSQTQFSSPEIGESQPVHDPNVDFSPTTTTPAAHVNLADRLNINLNHSYSTSPMMCRESQK